MVSEGVLLGLFRKRQRFLSCKDWEKKRGMKDRWIAEKCAVGKENTLKCSYILMIWIEGIRVDTKVR